MNIKQTLYTFSAFLLIGLMPLDGFGQSQSDRGKEIFEEVDNRRAKITYEQADMKMVIYDSKGRTRTRELKSYNYDADGSEKSLLVFEAPANVKGTSFLTISEGSDDLQKLYLPALSRIQTITASQKGDRFMGSDFTYEDLGNQDPDEYDFELLSESAATAVLRAEKKGDSQYDHIKFYVDTERYVLNKAEYFNEKGEMIKRLETDGYTNPVDNIWLAGTMTMFDLREDRKTELSWTNRRINEDIPGWRFTERGLRRN